MLIEHFQMLARYNAVANERLYLACSQLSDQEYRAERAGSMGSVHRLLNHILLGDRIWMARFTESGAATTPVLTAELYAQFHELRAAREAEDASIAAFMSAMSLDFLGKEFRYVNNQGNLHADPAPVALAHFFNHQTHHRGQVHVMLAQTSVTPPPLDLHRIIRPNPENTRSI